MINQKPFKELIVVELANVLAGPLVGMFFAELGAKVIKIENKRSEGDITRKWKLAREKNNSGSSAYYTSANWGKKSIFLDLNKNSDKNKVYTLVKDADVVITNYKKGDATKLGMNYEALKKINSNLIYGHISGYGENDPRVAFDLVLQAETGFMSMNGTKESGPLKMPVALIDLLAAHQLKEGILIALLNRFKTKKGSKVSVSLYDTALASLANQSSNYLNTGYVPQLNGSLHPNIAPYGETFKTKDNKFITLAIGTDKQFIDLCLCLDDSSLFINKLFISNQQRVKNRKTLFKKLEKKIQKFTLKKISDKLKKNKIPHGTIQNLKEVLKDKNAKKLILSSIDSQKVLKTVVFNHNL